MNYLKPVNTMELIDEQKILITKNVEEHKKVKMSIGFVNFTASTYFNPKYKKYFFNVGFLLSDTNIADQNFEIQIYIQSIPGSLKKTILHSSQNKTISLQDSYAKIAIEIPSKTLFKNEQKMYVGFFIRKIIGNQSAGSFDLKTLGSNNYLEKLWNEKLFSDFVFKVKDQEFPVHKNILAAQSNVFKVMFSSEHKMNIANTVEITDISLEVFHQFLEYLYIRKIPEYNENTLDLYKAAHKYNVEELMNLCESLFKPKVCENNAMKMLEFANNYEMEIIRKSAFDIIQEKIFPTEKLSPNLEYYPKLVKQLIEAKELRNKTLDDAKKLYDAKSVDAVSRYTAELDAVSSLINDKNKKYDYADSDW